MHKALRNMPLWLNEDFAEYYSTAAVKDGYLILGQRPSTCAFTASLYWRSEWHEGTTRYFIPVSEVIPASVMIRTNRGGFYAKPLIGPKATYDENKHRFVHRASAWALVHMFLNGPSHYAEALGEALSQAAAGEWVLSALSPRLPDDAQLDQDYRDHIRQPEIKLWKIPHSATPLGPVEVSTLTPADTLALGGRLLTIARGSPDPMLDRALAIEPDHPEAHYLKGVAACHRKDYLACEKHLTAAARVAPNEPSYWARLLWLYDENPDSMWSAAHVGQRMADVEAKLVPLALGAYHHNMIAWAKVRRGQAEQAEAHAAKALLLEPDCWECLDTMARVKYERGDTAAAVHYQQLALDRAATHVNAKRLAELEETLRKYREEPPTATAPTSN